MRKALYLLLALAPAIAPAQSQDRNYVMTTARRDSVPGAATAIQVTYLDGLGRPVQQRSIAQSANGRDIVTHIGYDALGRQPREYLPYAADGSSLAYSPAAEAETASYYASPDPARTGNPDFATTLVPYSEKLFEASPLNRVLKQGAPGEAWAVQGGPSGADHTVRTEHSTNGTRDNVRRFRASSAWSPGLGMHIPSLLDAQGGTAYPIGKLYKTITRDENWTSGEGNTSAEFRDTRGRVLLKRAYLKAKSLTVLSTYYVHDQFGNLSYVIPPLAGTAITQGALDGLCYQYAYDGRNRMVEKKIPGKGWEFVVYDRLDRPVAAGPALNPMGGPETGWAVTRYDALGRAAYTLWHSGHPCQSSADRKALQDHVDGGAQLFEARSASGSIEGIPVGYTNACRPAGTATLLSVSHYDDYAYPGAPALPPSVEGQNVMADARGLATGGLERVLAPGPATCEASHTLYDRKARPVRTHAANHLGGHTTVDTRLDFAGKALYTVTRHRRLSGDPELALREEFAYSPQDRPLSHTHQINGGPVELLSESAYDELGLLIAKGVGDRQGAPQPLQRVNYAYNLRGWLKSINDVDGLVQPGDRPDLFAFRIAYDQPSPAAAQLPLYNGNISETQWKSASDGYLRAYAYSYDTMNRLLAAQYIKQGMVTGAYDEFLSYDLNGNITSLQRTGAFDFQNSPIAIDELAYTYHPVNRNRLMKVHDASGTDGFTDDVPNGSPADPTDDYAYDALGNMTSDQNKGITEITYNHLNLPSRIVFSASTDYRIDYAYAASGKKIGKTVTRPNGAVAGGIEVAQTDYLAGFQYLNGVLLFFPTAEGYVNHTKGSHSYVYNHTDHLGNIRMSYAANPQLPTQLKVIEESHYYPFGLKHANYNSEELEFQKNDGILQLRAPSAPTVLPYKYKYNGKEFQDELGLNVYDYGARNYDPAIGRWMNIDPMAEKYFNFTPYSYVGNMPTIAIDPDGKDIVFTQSVRDDGTRVIQMTVTGKLINQSSNAYTKEQMSVYNERISSYMKEAYSMSGSDDSGGKYEVNVSVNLTTASEDNPLSETDTAFRIVDPGNIPDFQQGGFLQEDTPGAADFNQNIVYLSTSVMDKKPREGSTTGRSSDGTGGATLERTASHETGHAGGLHHPRLNEKNLMHQTSNKNAGTKINYQQLLQMLNDYNNGLLNQGRQE